MFSRRHELTVAAVLASLALSAVGCSKGDAAEMAVAPDEAIVRVARGIADGRPEVAWQSLPESYQQDVTDLLHEAAAKADPELWEATFGTLKKLRRVLSEKRDFILDHPMLASQVKDRSEAESNWNAIVGMFNVVLDSELADPKEVQTLDVEKFLAGTGSRLFKQLSAASALTAEDTFSKEMAKLRATKATVVSSSGDSAVVRIEKPGAPPTEEPYVRVEGSWIPKQMADEWPTKIAEAKQKLAQFSAEDMQQNKQTALMQLSMVDGALDTLLKAKTADEFNAGLGAVMGMAMGAMMSNATMGGGAPGLTPDMSMSPGSGAATLPPVPDVGPSAASTPRIPVTTPQRASGLDEHADGKLAVGSEPGLVPADSTTIAVADAQHYVGQRVRVVGNNGFDAVCTLKKVSDGVLVFEQEFAAGAFSVELTAQDIETLELEDR